MELNRRTSTLTILLGLLALVLAGCSAAATPASPVYTWQVITSEVQIKDSLQSVEVVTQYNGTKNEVTHVQAPVNGNTYVLIKAKVKKTGTQPLSFQWSELKLIDAKGQEFTRHPNDSFLEQQQYTPRMTGLNLRLGESEGWMAYEVPKTSASGDISLVYRDTEGERKIALNK